MTLDPSPQPLPPSARRSLLVLLALAFALTAVVLWPFRTPLFLSVVLAGALRPLHVRLSEKLRGRKRLASFVMAIALLALLLVPIGSLLSFAAHEMTAGLGWLRDEMGVRSMNDLTLEQLPASARKTLDHALALLHMDEAELSGYLARALAFVQSASGGLLGASLGLLGGTLLTVAGFSILLSEGDAALAFLYSISPLSRGQTEELLGEFRSVSSAAVLGTTATSLVQGTLAMLAYLMAGVPHAIFLGLATLVASFIPVIGSALIWSPICAVLAFQGRLPWAIFIAVWCGLLIAICDNIIKPLVMKNGVEMHAALIFLSLLGGIAAFGLIGIIIGPLAVSLLLAILRMYRRDYAPASRPPPPLPAQRA